MAAKDVLFGDDARQRMLAGVNVLADAWRTATCSVPVWHASSQSAGRRPRGMPSLPERFDFAGLRLAR